MRMRVRMRMPSYLLDSCHQFFERILLLGMQPSLYPEQPYTKRETVSRRRLHAHCDAHGDGMRIAMRIAMHCEWMHCEWMRIRTACPQCMPLVHAFHR